MTVFVVMTARAGHQSVPLYVLSSIILHFKLFHRIKQCGGVFRCVTVDDVDWGSTDLRLVAQGTNELVRASVDCNKRN